MRSPIEIYAGANARRLIQQHGFNASLFKYFLGASGGPKWFCLTGLDRVLFPEFFKAQGPQIQVIGSSAGAFRAACLVQNDPYRAINRLAKCYSETRYSDKPDSREITQKAKALIEHMAPSEGITDALSNDRFKLHIFTVLCHGKMSTSTRVRQLSGLLTSSYQNWRSRERLSRLYTRVVFSAPSSKLVIDDPYELPTERVDLTFNNFRDALLASGAIPLVIDGVEHIVNAPPGIYRDGGIIDYHFDLNFGPSNGLVLYPHFYPRPIAGWFDKALKKRRVHESSYSNVVMLVPSDEFVHSLPFNKIPDRKDFEKMSADVRIPYWQRVISESDRLGEAFMQAVESEQVEAMIKPLPFATI